jgi:hypothetical protein
VIIAGFVGCAGWFAVDVYPLLWVFWIIDAVEKGSHQNIALILGAGIMRAFVARIAPPRPEPIALCAV